MALPPLRPPGCQVSEEYFKSLVRSEEAEATKIKNFLNTRMDKVRHPSRRYTSTSRRQRGPMQGPKKPVDQAWRARRCTRSSATTGSARHRGSATSTSAHSWRTSCSSAPHSVDASPLSSLRHCRRFRVRSRAVQRKWDRAHFCAMHRVVCVGAVPARPTARPRRYEAEMNNLSAAVHAQESSAHAPNAARTHSPSSTRHYLVRKRKALRCRLPRARGVGEHTCACAQVSNRAADEALNDTLSSQLQVRSPAAACVECQRNCARVSMGGAACVRVASALKSARRASPTASSGVLCRRASRCASRSGAARSRTVRRRRRASVARHRRRSDRQCRVSSSSSARARRGCISRVKRAPCM